MKAMKVIELAAWRVREAPLEILREREARLRQQVIRAEREVNAMRERNSEMRAVTENYEHENPERSAQIE